MTLFIQFTRSAPEAEASPPFRALSRVWRTPIRRLPAPNGTDHKAAFHPDLSGPNRTYPDLKKVKTRLHVLVLGSGAFSVPRSAFTTAPQNSAIFAPICTCLRLVALWRGEIKDFQSGPTAQNRTSTTTTVAAEVRRRIPFDVALDPAP